MKPKSLYVTFTCLFVLLILLFSCGPKIPVKPNYLINGFDPDKVSNILIYDLTDIRTNIYKSEAIEIVEFHHKRLCEELNKLGFSTTRSFSKIPGVYYLMQKDSTTYEQLFATSGTQVSDWTMIVKVISFSVNCTGYPPSVQSCTSICGLEAILFNMKTHQIAWRKSNFTPGSSNNHPDLTKNSAINNAIKQIFKTLPAKTSAVVK